jgi:hypothetical protein
MDDMGIIVSERIRAAQRERDRDFPRYGPGWQHYRDHGDDMTYGRFEVFDAGHAPVLVWRPADVPGVG